MPAFTTTPSAGRDVTLKSLLLVAGACTLVALVRLAESYPAHGTWTIDMLLTQIRWRMWDWWFWVPGAIAVRQLVLRYPRLVAIDVRALALHGALILGAIVLHRVWSLVGLIAFDASATWSVFVNGHFFALGSMPMVDVLIWATVVLVASRGGSSRTIAGNSQTAGPTQKAGSARTAGPEYLRVVLARVGRNQRAVDVSSIHWIEADGYCVRLHDERRVTVVRMSMASLEASLDPSAFVRAHRSAIVARRSISDLRSNGAGVYDIVLKDGRSIPVSRSRYAEIREWLASGSKS